MEEEKWLPVVGYEGSYEVSDFGRVRSLDVVVAGRDGSRRRLKGRLRSPRLDKRGYRCLILPHKKNVFVHRLVAAAFLGAAPEGKSDVNHIDFNPENNHVSNLEWASRSENLAHSRRFGRYPTPTGRVSRLSTGVLDEIRDMASTTTLTQAEIGEHFVISGGYVGNIISGVVRPSRPYKAAPNLCGSAALRPERANKLSLGQVREMRDAYAIGGVRQVDLAKRFGVHQSTVSSILRGATWG